MYYHLVFNESKDQMDSAEKTTKHYKF